MSSASTGRDSQLDAVEGVVVRGGADRPPRARVVPDLLAVLAIWRSPLSVGFEDS